MSDCAPLFHYLTGSIANRFWYWICVFYNKKFAKGYTNGGNSGIWGTHFLRRISQHHVSIQRVGFSEEVRWWKRYCNRLLWGSRKHYVHIREKCWHRQRGTHCSQQYLSWRRKTPASIAHWSAIRLTQCPKMRGLFEGLGSVSFLLKTVFYAAELKTKM